jgi:hypothetical protein
VEQLQRRFRPSIWVDVLRAHFAHITKQNMAITKTAPPAR